MKIKFEIEINDKGFDFHILGDPVLSRHQCKLLSLCWLIQSAKINRDVRWTKDELKYIDDQLIEFMKTFEHPERLI